jgi:NAD(P)-dependent dehydrogenase (short-subunit alcohol dehydrogenase family)
MALRVVVIGGLGNFGARICRRLALEAGIELIATSRRPAAAAAAAAAAAKATSIVGSRPVVVAALDIERPRFADDLATLAPDLVIHCAGPFQGQDYRVAIAGLNCGAHYVDLADGREFVKGFVSAVDSAARAAGRAAICGASTLPALSTAVIDRFASSFSVLETVEVLIAPGQRAPRGRATVAAVLGYAGRPFSWLEDGAWRIVHGWQELEHVRFSFGDRLAAACDVPDLDLLPARYATLRTATFRAALELSAQHRVLWLIAALRRFGVPLPVVRAAQSIDRIAQALDRFGGDVGGMRVRLAGRNAHGEACSLDWDLVARANDGPEIPAMAAVLLACRLNRGRLPTAGAAVCTGLLSLAEFESEFGRWRIATSVTGPRGDVPTPV